MNDRARRVTMLRCMDDLETFRVTLRCVRGFREGDQFNPLDLIAKGELQLGHEDCLGAAIKCSVFETADGCVVGLSCTSCGKSVTWRWDPPTLTSVMTDLRCRLVLRLERWDQFEVGPRQWGEVGLDAH